MESNNAELQQSACVEEREGIKFFYFKIPYDKETCQEGYVEKSPATPTSLRSSILSQPSPAGKGSKMSCHRRILLGAIK